jgi:hypothetical protein
VQRGKQRRPRSQVGVVRGVGAGWGRQLRQRIVKHRAPWLICAPIPLATAIVSMLLALVPDAAEILAWQRNRILAGEWLRLIGGHLAHWDLRHAALNGAGAVLLGVCFRELPTRFWSYSAMGAIAACGVGMYWGPGALDEYRGLSAVLYGWLVSAALVSATTPTGTRGRSGWHNLLQPLRLLMLGVVGLALTDAAGIFGARMIVAGVPVHGPAHLYGIAGAVIGAVAWRTLQRRSSRPAAPSRRWPWR